MLCYAIYMTLGADTSMMTQCRASIHSHACLSHIDAFATTGLRTLVAAKRDLSEEEAMAWISLYKKAKVRYGTVE